MIFHFLMSRAAEILILVIMAQHFLWLHFASGSKKNLILESRSYMSYSKSFCTYMTYIRNIHLSTRKYRAKNFLLAECFKLKTWQTVKHFITNNYLLFTMPEHEK